MIAALVLGAVNFMNFTYPVNPCDDPGPVTVENGKGSYANPKDPSMGFDIAVDRVVEGSLRAGTRQAVVVLTCTSFDGGGAEAYLFEEDGNRLSFVQKVADAQWGADWGGDTIHIRFADNFLYVDRCKIPNCRKGEDYVVTTYAVRNGKIVRIYEQTHKRATFP